MASGQIENVVPSIIEDAPKWLEIARGELGQTEYLSYSKSTPNPRVSEYFTKLGLPPDPINTPWCAIFVCWALEVSNYSSPKSASARSFLTWGQERQGKPNLGDVVVLWRGKSNDGITGHVGFYVREDEQYVYLLGGNQGDAVTEAKFLKSKIIGVRYPRTMWKSKTSWAGGGVSTTGVGSIVDGVTSSVDVGQAQEAKTLFEQVMQYFPNYKIMLGVAITVLGLYIIYNRQKDNREKGV
jgi:uncharacterized protein (TIGR02594 family)